MTGEKMHEVLANMGVVYESVEQISSEENKPVFKVVNHSSQYILKCQEKSPHRLKRFVTEMVGTTGAKNERLLYQWFASQSFRCFRHPALIASFNNNLLIEFIPHSSNEKADSKLIKSLVEFYKKTGKNKFSRLHVLLHGIRYSSALNIIRTLPAIRKSVGFYSILSTLKAIARCYRKQPLLEKSFYIHNDFSSNNIINNEEQRYPVIIDFQSAKKEHRWLFNDIVRYAFYGDERVIDVEIINEFIKKIDHSHFGDNIKIDVQIRYALIVRTIQSILYKPKKSIICFLKQVLLDDVAFKKWFNELEID